MIVKMKILAHAVESMKGIPPDIFTVWSAYAITSLSGAPVLQSALRTIEAEPWVRLQSFPAV
jgi:hypothetical protein